MIVSEIPRRRRRRQLLQTLAAGVMILIGFVSAMAIALKGRR